MTDSLYLLRMQVVMTAIDLALLKQKTAVLLDNFSNHAEFLLQLHEILDLFTNQTMRRAQDAQKFSLSTYHTPIPVLRHLERELAPMAEKFPSKAVLLVSFLWEDGTYESRYLSAKLTGMIPPTEIIIPVLSSLTDRLGESPDHEIQRQLLTSSFTRIRAENQSAFISLIKEWLNSSIPTQQGWGFQALLPLLDDPDFQNIPMIFCIITPALLAASPTTQNDLYRCIRSLARISPTETGRFLNQLIIDHQQSTLFHILRRLLPRFPIQLQGILRDSLREKRN